MLPPLQLVGVGIGEELAQLDLMEQSDHLDHLKRVGALFAIAIVGEGTPSSEEEQEAAAPPGGRADSSRTNEGRTDAGAACGEPAPSPTSPPEEREGEAGEVEGKQQQQQQQQQQQKHQDLARAVQAPEREKDKRELDFRMEQVSTRVPSELELVELHASSTAAAVEKSCRRRKSLAYLLYRGLAAVYRDLSARARRVLVAECAADVGRIRQLASSLPGGGDGKGIAGPPPVEGEEGRCRGNSSNNNGSEGNAIITSNDPTELAGVAADEGLGAVGTSEVKTKARTRRTTTSTAVTTPEAAASSREARRAALELEREADRVARFGKVQREVLRRSTGEVIRLLAIDGTRRAPVDGGGRWSGGLRDGEGRAGNGHWDRGAPAIEVTHTDVVGRYLYYMLSDICRHTRTDRNKTRRRRCMLDQPQRTQNKRRDI